MAAESSGELDFPLKNSDKSGERVKRGDYLVRLGELHVGVVGAADFDALDGSAGRGNSSEEWGVQPTQLPPCLFGVGEFDLNKNKTGLNSQNSVRDCAAGLRSGSEEDRGVNAVMCSVNSREYIMDFLLIGYSCALGVCTPHSLGGLAAEADV
jgi:hypothetical protein